MIILCKLSPLKTCQASEEKGAHVVAQQRSMIAVTYHISHAHLFYRCSCVFRLKCLLRSFSLFPLHFGVWGKFCLVLENLGWKCRCLWVFKMR